MSDYFPTDVQVRLGGDRDAAQKQIGSTRQLLFKALLMNQSSGGMPVQLSQRLSENDFATVLIIGDQKIVNIYSIIGPETSEGVFVPEFPEPTTQQGRSFIYMLSGIARQPTTYTDGDGNTYLRDFRPTAPTSSAYAVPNSYADNLKLGGLVSQVNQNKASLFSGAMKRVVQAVLGLGRIKDSSGYYLTAPSATSRAVPMLYGYNPSQTHGIYKAGTKNHWLIEISASRGVLAMPLPLIPSTRGASYRERLQMKGDVGGLAVVNEFGGLPSGETFPTGPDLTTAITDGKVLRLLEASDLTQFYTGGRILEGWAFADSGIAADAVGFRWATRAGETQPSVSGEHWRITLNLSAYNLSPGVGNPVGTGTASIQMLQSGKISKAGMRSFWISGASEQLSAPLYPYAALTSVQDVPYVSTTYFGAPAVDRGFGTGLTPSQEEYRDWGCVVRVFYDGERCERVKWVPHYIWESWSESYETPTSMIPGDDPNRGPFWKRGGSSGIKWSPQGFVSDSIDLRKISISQSSSPPAGYYHEFDGPMQLQHTYRICNLELTSCYERTDGEQEPQLPAVFTISGPLFNGVVGSGVFTYHQEDLVNIQKYVYSNNHYWASGSYYRGTGSYDGRPNATCALWTMAPGWCREGVVIARVLRYEDGTPSDVKALALFPQTGVFQVSVDATFGTNFAVPDYRYPMYFGAVINAGSALAYTMTKKIQYQPEFFALPSASPGWNHYGLLPDTGNLSVSYTNFIGGY